ncbi:MAG TPA: transketolase [Synergistales bacterium]|nr:transketolase [Synergistales bacterium]HOR53876.1 transketolase [Synergistales bacterium]HPK42686.1 transketolase [Synergistales bacterium]
MRGLKGVFGGFPVKSLEDEDVDLIKEAARESRAWAVTMTSAAGSGHPAGSLSSMEMYLMVYGAADITPENFPGLERDFVIISHGHTSPGAYAVLARYGFISPESAMAHFRQVGSPFQGHIERVVPGIDWGSGNLGQGLSAGVGFALAIRARGRQDHVYVLMSDGEQVKGQVAEARRIASHHRLAGITALVDYNDIQISGRTRDIMESDIPGLWRVDGWSVIECDGHDPRALYKALIDARAGDRPTVIICHTVMGKGVSFMEGVPDYHGKAASGDLYVEAMEELGASPALLDEALKGRSTGVFDPPSRPTSIAPSIVTGDPRSYGPDDRTDNRSGFGKALEDVGRLNYKSPGCDPLLVFDCDLAGSVKVEGFAKACPEWFIEAGVQEHSTATVAGAASICGVTSLWADFGVFGLGEAYNQQRLNDINHSNLKLALTHVGLDVGEDGETHQCIDYIGLLRNLFGWRLLVPADPNQADRMTRWALAKPGNVCIAMGRSKVPVVTDDEGNPFFAGDYVFRYGAVDLLRKGRDAAIITMGHMAARALRAREILKGQGFDVSVYHAGCPLHMDTTSIVEAARTGRIVTFEDHHASTGLGSIVASLLLKTGSGCPLRTLGVTRYGDSGASSEVLSAMGLDPENLAAAVRNLIVQ